MPMTSVPAPWRRPAALLLAAACCLLAAGPAGATKYAGAFMETGGGARALARGGAFTAVADDASATFWNPAGLPDIRGRQLMLMHSERFGDLIDRDFVAYVQPVGWTLLGGEAAGIGVSIIRLGIDDIPFTAQLLGELDSDGDGIVSDVEALRIFELQDLIEYESDQELAFMLSYGERRGAWQIGGTLKFIRQDLGPYSCNGIGMDLALLRPRIWGGLDFGLKLQDVTTTYLSWSTGRNETISPAVVPALAWRRALPAWNADLLLAASAETRFDHRGTADQYWGGAVSTNVHAGAEIGFNRRVFLRGGFDSGWDADNLTAGLGFRVAILTIDYAYAGDTLDIDEVTHRISVTAHF
jgi:hypothetical protein